jgi:hypothetical protein
MNKQELIAYIQFMIGGEYAGSQLAFARDKNLSVAYVNDVLRGRRDPGQKILDAVGVEKVVSYQIK